MNLILSAGSWLAQNWMLLVLVAVAVVLLVPTYLKQRKEVNNRNELNASIKKGTKIVTTAGVYGVVESIQETTDGKVVVISTGNSKDPSTITIHINAIMGIDNKTLVKGNKEKIVEKMEEPNETTEDKVEEKVEEKPTKKSTKKEEK